MAQDKFASGVPGRKFIASSCKPASGPMADSLVLAVEIQQTAVRLPTPIRVIWTEFATSGKLPFGHHQRDDIDADGEQSRMTGKNRSDRVKNTALASVRLQYITLVID